MPWSTITVTFLIRIISSPVGITTSSQNGSFVMISVTDLSNKDRGMSLSVFPYKGPV